MIQRQCFNLKVCIFVFGCMKGICDLIQSMSSKSQSPVPFFIPRFLVLVSTTPPPPSSRLVLPSKGLLSSSSPWYLEWIDLESETYVSKWVSIKKGVERICYPESLLLQTAAPPSSSCLVPTCPLVLKFLSLSSFPWLPLPSPLGGALFGGFATSVIGSSSSSSHSDSPLRLETANFQNQLEQFLFKIN